MAVSDQTKLYSENSLATLHLINISWESQPEYLLTPLVLTEVDLHFVFVSIVFTKEFLLN